MARFRLARICVLGAVALAATASVGSSADVDPRPYRVLLEMGATASIEQRFEALRAAGDERMTHRAFQAFRSLTPEQAEALVDWVEAAPASAVARIALAEWKLALAWERRGRGTARTMNSRARAAMIRHVGSAVELADAASSQAPGWLEPHVIALEAARLLGDRELAERAWASGAALAPASAVLWEARLDGLEVRWGGSYVLLERAAASAEERLAENPGLVLLRARADADRARDLRDAGDHRRALQHLDLALAHGEQGWLLGERAWTRQLAGSHAPALEDVERALALEPFAADHHHRRAHILMSLERFVEAERAAAVSVDLAPSEDHYAWVRYAAGEKVRSRAEWSAFVVRPTPGEAARRAANWLLHNGAVFLFAVGLICVAMWVARMAGGPAPETSGASWRGSTRSVSSSTGSGARAPTSPTGRSGRPRS